MDRTTLNRISPEYAKKFEDIIYSDRKKYYLTIYDYENKDRGISMERIEKIISSFYDTTLATQNIGNNHDGNDSAPQTV